MDEGSDISKEELKEIISEIEINSVPQQLIPQPTQQPLLPSNAPIRGVTIDDDPVKGDPNAPVTIIEYSDYQCPFCSRFYEQTLPLIQENYIDTGKVKFVYKDMPIDSLHPNARAAHIAAECADEQGKYWEYHDTLFENQSQWSNISSLELKEKLTQYATDLRLQTPSFESCMVSNSILEEVINDGFEAAQYGATGTPSFLIGNEDNGYTLVVGAQPFVVFQNAIDAQLN